MLLGEVDLSQHVGLLNKDEGQNNNFICTKDNLKLC